MQFFFGNCFQFENTCILNFKQLLKVALEEDLKKIYSIKFGKHAAKKDYTI